MHLSRSISLNPYDWILRNGAASVSFRSARSEGSDSLAEFERLARLLVVYVVVEWLLQVCTAAVGNCEARGAASCGGWCCFACRCLEGSCGLSGGWRWWVTMILLVEGDAVAIAGQFPVVAAAVVDGGWEQRGENGCEKGWGAAVAIGDLSWLPLFQLLLWVLLCGWLAV